MTLLGFAGLVLGSDREQVIAQANGEESRIADLLFDGWARLAVRKAADAVPNTSTDHK
jgi:hypothetical protein